MMKVTPSPNFQNALNEVFAHEGGYVDHKYDPGGKTKWGITIGTLARSRGVPKSQLNEADMRALTLDEAAAIYFEDYWLPVRGDDLPVGIGFMAFDFCVNSGAKQAVRSLQRSINHVSRQRLSVDGAIGPKTLGAAHHADVRALIVEYASQRDRFWTRLVRFRHFGDGWLRRGNGVISEARAMADGTYRAAQALRHKA